MNRNETERIIKRVNQLESSVYTLNRLVDVLLDYFGLEVVTPPPSKMYELRPIKPLTATEESNHEQTN